MSNVVYDNRAHRRIRRVGGEQVQADWRDGTLADYALWPASAVTPAEDLTHIDSVRLAVSSR